MTDAANLIEHRIPDVVSTVDLPARLAAELDFLAGRVARWNDPSATYPSAIAARSLAVDGRAAEALAVLQRFDVAGATTADVAVAGWAASRVGGELTGALLQRLDSEAVDVVVDDGVPIGPRLMFVGLLHAARGDLLQAIHALRAAVVVGDARAPLWGAMCRLELGRILRTAESVPLAGIPDSAPVLTAARTFFAAGGYRSLLARTEGAGAAVPAMIEVGTSSRVGFGVQPPVVVRSSKGMVALGHLVANQHRFVSAAELALAVDGRDAARIASVLPDAWRPGDDDDVDVAADDAIEEIRSVLFDDATRSRMTKLLRRTIVKLSESHRSIADHLDVSVVTGHGCRYQPAGASVDWSVLLVR